jgi:hypothetical protein
VLVDPINRAGDGGKANGSGLDIPRTLLVFLIGCPLESPSCDML